MKTWNVSLVSLIRQTQSKILQNKRCNHLDRIILNLQFVNNKKLWSSLFVFIITVGLQQNIKAQTNSDSISVKNEAKEKPIVIKPHSPHKASLYSAVLPGLGQAYNKKYWKIPILYAGFAGIIYAIDFNSRNYSKYRRGYRDYLIQDPNNTSYLKIIEKTSITPEDIAAGGRYAEWFENTLENGKNYYERWRNLSYVGFALVYIINIIDASVDAHFKTFDVSDDLSMRVEPVVQTKYGNNSIGLQLKLVF